MDKTIDDLDNILKECLECGVVYIEDNLCSCYDVIQKEEGETCPSTLDEEYVSGLQCGQRSNYDQTHVCCEGVFTYGSKKICPHTQGLYNTCSTGNDKECKAGLTCAENNKKRCKDEVYGKCAGKDYGESCSEHHECKGVCYREAEDSSKKMCCDEGHDGHYCRRRVWDDCEAYGDDDSCMGGLHCARKMENFGGKFW